VTIFGVTGLTQQLEVEGRTVDGMTRNVTVAAAPSALTDSR
jgi:hypothetical protein